MRDPRPIPLVVRTAARMLPALLALSLAPPAAAQQDPAAAFPAKPLRLIVPFLAGGAPDIVARIVAKKLTESWGAPVIIDNRTGATGNIGMKLVVMSAPDGYTLGELIISHSVNAAVLGSKMPYDILRDLTPITQLVGISYVLVANAELPVKSVTDLVAHAGANPGAVRYGSSGTGGVIHLAGELLGVQAKVKMTHVPYKGNAGAITDVAGGRIEMMFTSVTLSKSFIAKGQLRALAVTSQARLPSVPDLPTMQEAGVPGYDVTGWYGVAGPAGMPAAIVEKLNREMVRAVKLPDTRQQLDKAGLLPVGSTPAQFAALLRAEDEKWRNVVQAAGIAR